MGSWYQHAIAGTHAPRLTTAGCATVAEVRKRGSDFWAEFEFYLSDLLVGECSSNASAAAAAPAAGGPYPACCCCLLPLLVTLPLLPPPLHVPLCSHVNMSL